MRRVAYFLIRNWPLKLAAVLLATVLYSGLVLGQNVRTWTGVLTVQADAPPIGATLLSTLDPVTQVRYRAPLDVSVVSPDTFRANVDLSRVRPAAGGPPTDVTVTVTSVDIRVQVVDFQPRTIQVRLDPVGSRTMPVTVDLGTVPDGLNLGPPQTEPSSVTIRGGTSNIEQVSSVLARVAVDASALNIDREFELVPVDANGNQVANVQVEPERARVRIAVARELATRTLPVVPQVTGQLSPGYRISSITVEPLVVTVSGEASIVTQLETAMTEPIDLSGRTRDVEATVRIALPAGVSVSGGDLVRVIVTVAEETGTRTFQVGLTMEGDGQAISYSLQDSSVQVTLAGPTATLDAVDPTSLLATVDVLSVPATTGEYLVPVVFEPPEGLAVIAISPDEVVLAVVQLATTSEPTPAPQ